MNRLNLLTPRRRMSRATLNYAMNGNSCNGCGSTMNAPRKTAEQRAADRQAERTAGPGAGDPTGSGTVLDDTNGAAAPPADNGIGKYVPYVGAAAIAALFFI